MADLIDRVALLDAMPNWLVLKRRKTMQKTPDEIKKWLNDPFTVHFHISDIEPRMTPLALHDLEFLHTDALTYIKQLEAKNAKLLEKVDQLQAEREMIRQAFCKYVPSVYRCDCCKHSYLNNPGTDCCPYVGQCDGYSKWEYYGIQED